MSNKKHVPTERERKSAEIDSLMSLFNTEIGQKLLVHLEKTYVYREIVRDNDTQFQAGKRQGKADVIRDFRQYTDRLMKGEKNG